jgi:hypothetical protein
VLISLKAHDEALLERSFAQLKTFYDDTRWAHDSTSLALGSWRWPAVLQSRSPAAATSSSSAAPGWLAWPARCRPLACTTAGQVLLPPPPPPPPLALLLIEIQAALALHARCVQRPPGLWPGYATAMPQPRWHAHTRTALPARPQDPAARLLPGVPNAGPQPAAPAGAEQDRRVPH